MARKTSIQAVIDDHLISLDKAEVSPDSIFDKTKKRDKERYETLLMYSYRKYQAAKYHLANVQRFLSDQNSKASTACNTPISAGLKGKISIGMTKTCNEYTFELSAFLEALKSSIDILAEVSSWYLSGINANFSIRPIMKIAKSGKTGSIIDEVKRNISWLEALRDYRHHLVHRLMPSVATGYETHMVGKLRASTVYPVVVPKSTPSYIPDTREARITAGMMEDSPMIPGLGFMTSEVKLTHDDGKEETTHLSIEATPSEGYIPIDDFMKEHLKHYRKYLKSTIASLAVLNFKRIAVGK